MAHSIRRRCIDVLRYTGHLHIADFLAADGAALLASHLRERQDWALIINQGDKLELDRKAQAALTRPKRSNWISPSTPAPATAFSIATNRSGCRIPPRSGAPGASLLTRFASFLVAPATLAFLREVTGAGEIAFVDAQATAYSGHFLTSHDDDVAGKNRYAAYVMNLSADWRADWGGLLMIQGGDGHVEKAYVPRFNALNLFKVPRPHSVSYVAPYAPYRRYSVTGWLRATPPPL